MAKHITQKEIDTIVRSGNYDFDLSLPIDIEDDYRIEDLKEGETVVMTITLLNGKQIRKEYLIIESQNLLLLTEEEKTIRLRYGDDDKYYVVDG